MPIFEFECPKCGKFELLLRHSDIVEACPTCNSEIKKLISAPTPIFKGQGFYSTDYVNKKKNKKDKIKNEIKKEA